MSAASSYFARLVAESIQELLGLYGMTCEPTVQAAAPERGRLIMASIGFGGDCARGAMTVIATRAFWHAYATSAGMDESLPDALLSDMAGEFANMVMGRMRNRLLRDGLTIHQATPTCAFGEEIAFRDPGVAEVCWQRFGLPSGPLYSRLDACVSEAFERPVPERPVIACADEVTFF